jgi:hypothetical protein
MKEFDTKQFSGSDKHKPRSFSETAEELLRWQRDNFSSKSFRTSNADGKEEIKRSFVTKDGAEDNPERLIRITDFLVSKMKIDDGAQLRKTLSELIERSSASISPIDKKSPNEILSRLLTGKYDDDLDASKIADRGQAYVLALYLYMHTSGDSEKEMTDVLAQLIDGYDDPKADIYEHGIVGIKAEPPLALLCFKAIGKHHLSQVVRKRLEKTLGINKLGNK